MKEIMQNRNISGFSDSATRLARKLAVIMHRMLADGTTFTTQPA